MRTGIGNSDPIAEPDVRCPAPEVLRPNATSLVGNSREECCVIHGLCVGNTYEPDIVCPSPSQLVVGGRGRSVKECCVTHGMCSGSVPAPHRLLCWLALASASRQ